MINKKFYTENMTNNQLIRLREHVSCNLSLSLSLHCSYDDDFSCSSYLYLYIPCTVTTAQCCEGFIYDIYDMPCTVLPGLLHPGLSCMFLMIL